MFPEAVPKAHLSADLSCQFKDIVRVSLGGLQAAVASHITPGSHPFQTLGSHLKGISRKLAVQVNYQQQSEPLTKREKGGEVRASKIYGTEK